MLCCWISAAVSLVSWLVHILAVPALTIFFVIVLYAIITAKHPPNIDIYESERTFQDPGATGTTNSLVNN